MSTNVRFQRIIEYEWDENKNQSNQEKHGIDFRGAVSVFSDEDKIELIDQRKDYGELRYKVIGIAKEIIVVVIYTIRNDRYRIISARVANEQERKTYYYQKK